MDAPIELVNVRVSLRGRPRSVDLPAVRTGPDASPVRGTRVFGVQGEVRVWQREALATGQLCAGPALICETVATTYLAPDWSARVDEIGNLLLERIVR